MAYLNSTDLTAFLDERELAALKRDYEADGIDKLPVGINYAENYVKDRLSSSYNIAVEYAKTGDDRSTTLLEILAHLAIWKLAATFPTVQLDGKRHYNYENALKDLDAIANGKLLTTLPLLSANGGGVIFGQTIDMDVIF